MVFLPDAAQCPGTGQLEGLLMGRACRGFSLIEAMISALVLSIGLLGLGQLQARLHLASQRGAETMYAAVISSEFYEKSATYELSTIKVSTPSDARRLGSSTIYTVTSSSSIDAIASRRRIHIQWLVPEGMAETGTTSLFSLSTIPFDTRWLLGRY
jgi:Tfp pilus assembly protein PilV